MKRRVAIIGAGVVGCSIARELARYVELEVHVLEKEADVGWGASKANTGIIHAGYDDDPEKYPLRAKLCSRGNLMWREIVRDLHVPIKWCGALVCALNESETKILDVLLARGRQNGVDHLSVLGADECRHIEPNLSERITGALFAQRSGVISPYEAAIGLAENAVGNGTTFHLETKVERVVVSDAKVVGLETERGFFRADLIINAAGIFGDQLSETANVGGFSIRPRRGEYFVFDRDISPMVKVTLFPTPRPDTKGVVVTPTAEGNLLIGPNSQDLRDDEREAKGTTRSGLNVVWDEASRLVASLPPRGRAIRTFAGLRAEPDRGDFIIEKYDDPSGFVNCVGIRSPGLTSAPAIAREVVSLLERSDVELTAKRIQLPGALVGATFRDSTPKERDAMISTDPRHGNMVCICEMVTEAEVRSTIRRGATTVDSIKFRTRAGMGRCQGSFCLAKVMSLISEETDIPMEQVTMKGDGSRVCLGKVRGERS